MLYKPSVAIKLGEVAISCTDFEAWSQRGSKNPGCAGNPKPYPPGLHRDRIQKAGLGLKTHRVDGLGSDLQQTGSFKMTVEV